ncbi:Multidrug efflux pump subunit AcrB [Methylacidimicrobium cyclopophantes]|uniref:Multidrug efflux pump subunit AcrB n=1 Tax=Methylacidimicrobium cyclopophantes TaxID=1041766 RepID=A0A5E6MC03_9BACT|nr:efflux RND transporter permease subunit [Methylacidimicrobium cyclopophantes]VVM05830.1 Multidrug efflux pump subunit AcrB [Methylacidimicrobium cyclopophantes]
MSDQQNGGAIGGFIRFFSSSLVTPLLILASWLLGAFALVELPREEEPQIVVPLFDIFVSMPGASPEEVEKRIVNNGERVFWEIPGVEYVYSTAAPNGAVFIVRFRVGEDMERSLIKLFTKVYSHLDFLPPGASLPLIKPRSIDDVPILALTFYSPTKDPLSLRRIVATVRDKINPISDISETTILGGRKRQFQVFFDPAKLAAHLVTPADLVGLIRQNNVRLPAGHVDSEPKLVDVEPNALITSKEDLENLVVSVSQGKVVYLRDVAQVVDGPDQDERSLTLRFGRAASAQTKAPIEAVTLAIAKRKGANATFLAKKILADVDALRPSVLPPDVHYVVTRNYGQTAAEKSNELLEHMGIAIFGVSFLIALFLGWRAAAITAIAIPTTLAITLLTFHLFHFTINRVTLFALIFTIGILVDDPIVGVENIVRHLHLPTAAGRSLLSVTIEAMLEIVGPLILATLAVIAAILPMATVGGLMGPYMRPIPIGATTAMIVSMLVSLSATPWASVWLLKGSKHAGERGEGFLLRLYRAFVTPLIYNRWLRLAFVLSVLFLLTGAVALIPLKLVRAKMLPFDNKNEFQVILNMPEGTPLQATRSVLDRIAEVVLRVPEVTNVEIQAGTHSPYNFNGLIRHYFLREFPYQGDLQVNLTDKSERKRQSHDIAESVRPEINRLVQAIPGAYVQVAEVPPGPPVLSTLVWEIYGPSASGRREIAAQIEKLMRQSPEITDIATYEESNRPLEVLNVDLVKASLNGLPGEAVTQNIVTALEGTSPGLAHAPDEPERVQILVRLPEELRRTDQAVRNLSLLSRFARLIPVKDLTAERLGWQHHPIYHKNLMPVTYLLGDVSGQVGSPVYGILDFTPSLEKLRSPEGKPLEILYTHLPESPNAWAIKWDGEWQVTFEVFRDLGKAFALVLVLIFILVVGWFRSFVTPWAVMLPIPLSLIGILPAHWYLGMFFTATSMIGMMAGAGIVVRNAIILVDFIEMRLAAGDPLEEAVISAGAVRLRPILLTALAVIIGSAVILFDPIFQGLALALMAGEIAATILSQPAVPVFYYMLHKRRFQKKTQPSPDLSQHVQP